MRRTTEDREAVRYERYAMCFQQSCMSNAKWRKALSAIAESDVKIVRTEFKVIDSDYLSHVNRGIITYDIGDTRIKDGGFQPMDYKWIEWMRFPRRVQTREGIGHYTKQDVERLRRAIQEAAAATMELDDTFLWLFGYKDRIRKTPIPINRS